MPTFAYQPTILQGTTKKGKLKCDPDGYYDVILGGFDTYNSANAFYTWSSAKSHFDKSHHFQRRIANSALYGEYGHPVYQPGMSKQDWIVRVMTINPSSKSHHIRELYVDDTVFKNKDGGPMVTIFGRVKPAGPQAQALGDSLDNEHENTAFSIRSITDDFVDPRTGIVIKNMREIVTYDYVDEPGIAQATKYNHPALESLNINDDGLFTELHVRQAIEHVHSLGGSFESAGIVESLESLLDSPRIIQPKTGIIPAAHIPLSASWK